MPADVSEQEILDALHRVPKERWGQALSFIESLRNGEESAPEGKRPMTAADLLNSGLVGIWADRTDIGDSREFARRLREQARRRGQGR